MVGAVGDIHVIAHELEVATVVHCLYSLVAQVEVVFEVILSEVGIQAAVDDGVVADECFQVLAVEGVVVHVGVAVEHALLNLLGEGGDADFIGHNGRLRLLLVRMAGCQ